MFLIKSELIYVHQCSNRVAQDIFDFNLSHMRVQQFNVNRQLQVRSHHLSVSKCNQRVEYEASHHFQGCSPGLADGDDLSRMSSHIDAPNPSHSATIYMTIKSSSQATNTLHNSGIYVNLISYVQTNGILLKWNVKTKTIWRHLPVTHFRPTFQNSVHQNYQADIKYVYKTVKSATWNSNYVYISLIN